MSHPVFVPALLLALVPWLGGEPMGGAPGKEPPRGGVSSVTIQSRIIIRIPAMPAGRMAISAAPAVPPPPPKWHEKKGPRCITMNTVAGAIPRPESVDLVLEGGQWMRAKLGDHCPALDFYSGFYIKPNADGMVCAGRDEIRSRSGDSCPIDAFKSLVAKR